MLKLDTNSKQPIDKGGRGFSQILYFVDDCSRLNMGFSQNTWFRAHLQTLECSYCSRLAVLILLISWFQLWKENLTTHNNIKIVPLLKVEWILVIFPPIFLCYGKWLSNPWILAKSLALSRFNSANSCISSMEHARRIKKVRYLGMF